MDVVMLCLPPILVGLFVGVCSGLLGIGGGSILVPIFKLGFSMEPIVCTATSLFTIIPTSVSGAATHIRNKTCIPKLGVAMGVGGAITSPVGVWLASNSPGWAIMVASAAVIIYSSYTMLRKAIKMGSAKARVGANNGEASLLHAEEAVPEIGRRELLIGAAIGFAAGVLSGYVGLGGGFLIIPLTMQFLNTSMKLTGGTSLIAVLIIVFPGVIYQAFLGNVDWIVGICVAVGSIPGAIVGATLVNRIPERALRFAFAGFLFVGATLLVIEQLGVF